MYEFIKTKKAADVSIITLDRPKSLNALNQQTRNELVDALKIFENEQSIHAIILTGASDRAFCAGQDLGEAKTFDGDRAEIWIDEWRTLYGAIRSLSKPLVIALNGIAAGAGFQVALLGDIRIGHPGVKMGQPEVKSGIASVTGPWIMKEMLGLSRTIELALTGRLMDGEECYRLGLLHKLVPQKEVMKEALNSANELASRPHVALRLTKQFFREMTEESFQRTMEAATRIHREAYVTGEPQAVMQRFFDERAAKRKV